MCGLNSLDKFWVFASHSVKNNKPWKASTIHTIYNLIFLNKKWALKTKLVITFETGNTYSSFEEFKAKTNLYAQ